MLKLGHFELFVADPPASMAFYRDQLGFRVVEIQTGHFVWLESNGIELLLRPGNPPRSAPTYEQTAIAFVLYTDDLLDAVEQLRQRGITPIATDQAGHCYTLTDPDGHWFQLVDPNHH